MENAASPRVYPLPGPFQQWPADGKGRFRREIRRWWYCDIDGRFTGAPGSIVTKRAIGHFDPWWDPHGEVPHGSTSECVEVRS